MPATSYKTRPLDCWEKLKELRRDYARRAWSPLRPGFVRILGGYVTLTSLSAGLGDVVAFGFGPYFSRIMKDRSLAIRCHEAAEARGYGPDTCGTLRVNLGSAFLGFHNVSRDGYAVPFDFCLDVVICESGAKASQIFAERYGLPYFSVDIPILPTSHDAQVGIRYLVAQMEEAIAWMEKVTGLKYQDELLVEAARQEWRSSVLWAKVCDLIKAIPAPIDLKILNSFISLMVPSRHHREVADLLELLYEETAQRVRDGIAAVATERCRLLYEGQYLWYYPPLLKVPREYGAVLLGGRFTFQSYGAFVTRPDGTWEVAQTPEERGEMLRTRQDALRALAELYVLYCPSVSNQLLLHKAEEHVKLAQDWHADGAIILLDRSCKGLAAGHMEANLAFKHHGIPTLTIEAANADPRQFSEVQVMDRLEAFLESLGLHRLTD